MTRHSLIIPRRFRLKPDYAMAYYNRAFEKMRQGDLDSANLDYTEAICLKSDYAEAYAYRGIVKVHLAHIGDPNLTSRLH